MSKSINWHRIQLGKTCKISTGKKDVNEGDPDGIYPFFTCSRANTFSNTYSFDTDAILIAGNGEVGNLHRYNGKFEAYQRTYVLDEFSENVEYVYQYIAAFLKLSLLRNHVGSTIPFIKLSDLTDFLLELPKDIPEQSKIAEVLSKVDQAIEQTESLIAKQQRIKTGLMQDLLTRGIDEHGNLRSEETHEFKDSPLGRIPVEWEFCYLDDCVPTFAPICYGILMPGYGHVGGVPVIKVKDIVGGRINQDDLLLTDPKIDSLYRRSRLKHGDLLLTIRGTTGRLAIVPLELEGANITQDTARVRLKDGYSNYFFYFLLQTQYLQDQINLHTLGQAVKVINIGEVKRLHFGLPKKQEQFEIAEQMIASQRLIDDSEYQLMKLRSLKTALMQDLLTGKVRVTTLLKFKGESWKGEKG